MAGKKDGWDPSKALSLADLDSKYGKMDNVKVTDGNAVDNKASPENRIRFGNDIALDYVTHGGLVRGAFTQLYGEGNAGKTLTAMRTACHVQRVLGENVLWVRARTEEYDKNLADKIGVDPEKIRILDAAESEVLVDMAADYIASGAFGFAVVDSIAALRPTDEISKGAGSDARMGGHTAILRTITNKFAAAMFAPARRTAVLYLNQIRQTPETYFVGGQRVQKPPHPPGGEFLKHVLVLNAYITRHEEAKDEGRGEGDQTVGQVVQYKGMKAKLVGGHGRVQRITSFIKDTDKYVRKAGDVDTESALLDIGIKEGIVEQSGAWYTFGGERHQGDAKFVVALRRNPDMLEELEKQVRATFFKAEGNVNPEEEGAEDGEA